MGVYTKGVALWLSLLLSFALAAPRLELSPHFGRAPQLVYLRVYTQPQSDAFVCINWIAGPGWVDKLTEGVDCRQPSLSLNYFELRLEKGVYVIWADIRNDANIVQSVTPTQEVRVLARPDDPDGDDPPRK